MRKELTPAELELHIEELLAADALELAAMPGAVEGAKDLYIPYMMSDAVESYLILTDTEERLPGGKAAAVFSEDPDRHLLQIHGESSMRLITYRQAFRIRNLYQYHRTGHYWIEDHEHLRRLFYLIATVYDKAQYLGEEYCNEKELELIPLIEFAPFRYWSPIHENMDDWYHSSEEGNACMEMLAEEAGDREYASLVRQYADYGRMGDRPEARSLQENMRRHLSEYLAAPEGEAIYQLLERKLEEASVSYPARHYDAESERKIETDKEKVIEKLLAKGYQGTYPRYQKTEAESGTISEVLVIEEQPFTVLDWDDFTYSLHLQVTERKGEQVRHYVIHE